MPLNLAASLRLLWIACILPVVIAFLPFSFLRRFRRIISEIAKRGKAPPKTRKFTVPHKFFFHFYALGLCWTNFLLGSMWFYACRATKMKTYDSKFLGRLWNCVFVLILFEIHLARRLFESFFVFKYNSSARMHLFVYSGALLYYVAVPLSLCASFILEGLNYTYLAMRDPRGGIVEWEITVWDYFKPLAELGIWQWAGGVVCFWAWIHQFKCHRILGSLRKGKGGDEYAIPRGDWFEVSSSAHYLAEIVIYVGLLIASGGTDATVALVLAFVVANLSLHAAETHQWYLRKFEDYPRSRKVIIPIVY